MATLGNALVNKILGHSAAEKAFRPWWDNMEDFLVYGLVMLGLIVAPTAIINGTPLDCTPCVRDHCDGKFDNDTHNTANSRKVEETTPPNFNAMWVKKYCTMTAVDQFILYFPYILLIMALVIVMIERVFIRIFKSGLKLDMFYNLLVKETLEDETGNLVSAGVGSGGGTEDMGRDLENSKTAIEVSQTFQHSTNYFLSYFLRTAIEMVLAGGLLAWLLLTGLPSIQKEEFIYCAVHGFLYECAGHPQQFYMYVLFVAIAILLLYLLCNFYNLLWLVFPQMGTLSSVMRKYKLETRKKSKDSSLSDKEMLGELYNIYYHNRDLKLLLDLLAESSGIAPSIRIMSLFDPDFRAKCEPTDLRVVKIDDKVEVEFGDSRTMKEIFGSIHEVVCIYTVEISPPTNKSSVVAFRLDKEEGWQTRMHFNGRGDTELRNLNGNGGHERLPQLKRTEFLELDPEKEYTIRVCTIVNGRAIARRTEIVKPGSQFD